MSAEADKPKKASLKDIAKRVSMAPPMPSSMQAAESSASDPGAERVSRPSAAPNMLRASVADESGSAPEKASLKDIAKRVSMVPSMPSWMQAAEPAASDPTAERASRPSAAPIVARAPEADESDSGMVNLQAMRDSVASMPEVPTEPGSSGLFDDEPRKSAPSQEAVRPVATAAAPQPSGSKFPLVAGVAVAAIAIVAAVYVAQRHPASAVAPASSAQATTVADPNAAASAANASAASPSGAAASPSQAQQLAVDDKAAGGTARPGRDPAAPGKPGEPAPADKPAANAPADTPTGLAGAMATAVGGAAPAQPTQAAAADNSNAAADTPSQGELQGAIGKAKGAARGCVANLDGDSRVSVVFGSDGSVKSVSVSGAAEGTPAVGCIKGAFMKARVAPFRRATYSTTATIRP